MFASRAPCHGVLTDASGRLLEPAERRYGLREAERISKAGGAVRVRPGCASKLAEAIRPFRDSSKSNLRFVLACRGTYEPTAEGTRVGVGTTTNSDVKNLIAAGWDVRPSHRRRAQSLRSAVEHVRWAAIGATKLPPW